MVNLAVNTNKIDVDDSSSRAVGVNVKSNESKDDDNSDSIENSESNADSVESTPRNRQQQLYKG